MSLELLLSEFSENSMVMKIEGFPDLKLTKDSQVSIWIVTQEVAHTNLRDHYRYNLCSLILIFWFFKNIR